jgi:hypothetical protein
MGWVQSVRLVMLKYGLKLAILLTILFALPIVLIRAQPYDDRVSRALIQENCPAPCFMRVRPGVTTMRDAVYLLQAHAWVANGREGFSALVRNAVIWDAALPRTVIGLRWSEAVPEWIDQAERGALTVEDREVLDISIATHLSMGEIILAFGEPDQSWFTRSNSTSGRRFGYIAWYATQRLLISTEGFCPARHYYDYPVRVIFRPDSPGLSESASKASVCG